MRSTTMHLVAATIVFAGATFSATGSGAAPQGSSPKTVWDGVYSDAQSGRGAEVSHASCVTCHGDELAGSDLAPALKGDDFKAVWSGKTAAELFEKIHTTMPADRAGTLKPRQSADLVAYLFKLNEFPSGAAELPSEMPALSQIKIASKK